MIEVEHLRKSYGDFLAVDDVDFRAEAGEIFGLLGPNGAGKTTTIGCISGLLRPSNGLIRVMGHDVIREGRLSREKLGVVPQELALYEDLTAQENLSYWGSAYGLGGSRLKDRVCAVLELTGLSDRSKEPVKKFSGGMKRRLNFACGIVHEPEVLLLDEPTVGVDPQSRVRLIDLVEELKKNGTCILYTTHYMEEAEDICDRLAIIDHGKIIAMGTLDELRSILGERDLLRLSGTFDPQAIRKSLSHLESLEVLHVEVDQLRLAVPQASRHLPAIFKSLTDAGAEIRETIFTQPSLESLFIKLTGKELRE